MRLFNRRRVIPGNRERETKGLVPLTEEQFVRYAAVACQVAREYGIDLTRDQIGMLIGLDVAPADLAWYFETLPRKP